MRLIQSVVVGAAILAAGMALGLAQPKEPEMQKLEDQAAEMAHMNRLRPEHKLMEQMCGDFEVKMTVMQQGMDPMVINAAATRRMIMNGQFLEERVEAAAPFPSSTIAVMGFNADAKDGPRFEVVRFGTMANCLMPENGTYDAAAKRFTLAGEHEINGMTGRVRVVIDMADPAHERAEVHLAMEGYSDQFRGVKIPEYQAMTMEYTRRK
jgi:hypothetical protein